MGVASLVLAGTVERLWAHPTNLQLKRGGPTPVEQGPHGGGVIAVGEGHFELVRGTEGVLSLFRLDSNLKAVPAGDAGAALLYVLGPTEQATKIPMELVRDSSGPPHFSVNPKVAQGGYLAVVSVSIGKESLNLRFQVAGLAQKPLAQR